MTQYFEHPGFLLLSLACIPAGFLFFIRFRILQRALIPFFSSRDEEGGSLLSRMITVRFACFALAWIFICGAASSPRWGSELVATRQEGTSVMFVMDISRSMSVSDITPYRLAFASRYAFLLTERMETTPCGVVLVKGSAVLALPLTTDHRTVLDLLSILSPSMLSSPGSGIAQGVQTALASFPRNSAASRSIILFTDGDETSSSLEEAARAVRSDGSALIIVGVGTAAGALIDKFPGSSDKATVTTRLREDGLRKAVHAAGGRSLYVSASENGSAIRVLEAAVPSTRNIKKLVYSPKPVYRYFEFLLASAFFICAGLVAGGLVWQKQ